MPYRFAPYYIVVCIAVIVAGFWQSYFSVWGNVPWQFHAHGVAASIWVLMVLAQSWTVHHDRMSLHRAVGKSSLLLFPFLIAGLFAIIDVTAKGYANGDLVRTTFGGEFLIGLALAVAAYVVLFYRALKFRRKVWAHSGYMLATPLILFESPFSRIIATWVPALQINGPQDFGVFMDSIIWAMTLELIVIAAIWYVYRDKAKPFVVAAIFIAAQMLTMGLMSDNAMLEGALVLLAPVPSIAVVAAGFALGALTCWAGWLSGKRPMILVGGAPQPA